MMVAILLTRLMERTLCIVGLGKFRLVHVVFHFGHYQAQALKLFSLVKQVSKNCRMTNSVQTGLGSHI
jgi:hypothetical protein